jgi:hypothetical protein
MIMIQCSRIKFGLFNIKTVRGEGKKMSAETIVLENEARSELLSRINEHVSFFPGSHNELLMDKFGITDGGDLINLSISKLTEIADFLDDFFL